jgi:hypothetical protein
MGSISAGLRFTGIFKKKIPEWFGAFQMFLFSSLVYHLWYCYMLTLYFIDTSAKSVDPDQLSHQNVTLLIATLRYFLPRSACSG